MMRAMGLVEVARVLGVAAPAHNVHFTAVSTDSRAIAPASLFVALCGERFDAHAFVGEAERGGAVALLCSRPVSAGVPVLLVPDTLRALGAIARHNRELFSGPVVALTGSAGKTTTREMIAAILRTGGPVHATAGNLNNEVGVPLTLLGLGPQAHAAVIEMGAARPGDIAYLAAFVRPDVALVTNALPAHLQGFGTLAAVAAAKGEIYEALGADGIAILNLDDPFAATWRARVGSRRVIGVSVRGDALADVCAEDVRLQDGCARFRLLTPAGCGDVRLAVPGVQQVANAVCAAAVGVALGVRPEAIRAGLQAVVPVAGRMQPRVTTRGALLIDDSYNANPGSVRAAIDSLVSFDGERVLVLGAMAELGAGSRDLHREVGAHARLRGVTQLFACGEHAEALAAGFGTGARIFASHEELTAACRSFDRPGCVILVKGSRAAAMERVVDALVDADPGVAGAGRH
ncbi:MAG: UDP-N-acetylmuramoyl-tripeptide--D-alanyl-D-alanine ligase [Pseudomonadales bacterium]|jgi:UDP-N-acetylmuramoyl-tripeptide--D-alanyl-D-alanine ligase|nr:UDP-N-acetylmuramoyl-tripeptide--D-alanyl-D-alanine ligase [Pseudomonadales bacterium]MCP5336443.1 UDP-N-acetylmuramoyl-tripeptide--D-alanyl-D-alanine ligase [Pseudomonadales bacterium]